MVFRQQQEEAVKAQTLLVERERQAATVAAVDPNVMDIDSQAAVDDAAAIVAAEEQEEATLGSKVIVIHPGSQNLRIGLANDALPKSLPNVIARRSPKAEFEEEERSPKRMKVTDDDGEEVEEPEALFGGEVCSPLPSDPSKIDITSSLKQSSTKCPTSLKSACATTNAASSPTLGIWSSPTTAARLPTPLKSTTTLTASTGPK